MANGPDSGVNLDIGFGGDGGDGGGDGGADVDIDPAPDPGDVSVDVAEPTGPGGGVDLGTGFGGGDDDGGGGAPPPGGDPVGGGPGIGFETPGPSPPDRSGDGTDDGGGDGGGGAPPPGGDPVGGGPGPGFETPGPSPPDRTGDGEQPPSDGQQPPPTPDPGDVTPTPDPAPPQPPQQPPPMPGDVQDRPQPPGAGPETIPEPEPVQGIETVPGAAGDVERAFRGRAIEQRALEQNPQLGAEDVRVTPSGAVVLTSTGEAVMQSEARQDFETALAGLGFQGVGTGELRAPEAPQAAPDISTPAGGFQTVRGGSPADPGLAAEGQRRELGADAGPVFTLPGLNIEAQAARDIGEAAQPADIRATRDFERRDLGDEFIQGEIPGPFEFGGPGVGRAEVDFPGAGEEIEPFLGRESRAFSTFAEQVGTGVEDAIPIPGLGGAAGQTARGVTEAVNPAGLALSGVEVAETGAFLAPDVSLRGFDPETGFGRGGPVDVDVGDIGARAEAVAGQAGPTTVQAGEFAQENPFQTTGLIVGGAATGVAAGRAIEGLPNLARSARIRAQGGDIFDVEDLSDPPETTMGELPRFTDPAVEDPDVAVREFEQQAETGALSKAVDEPTVFSGRAAEDVAEFGGFGRQFDAPEGGAEIPGLFFAADLSPLRLPGSTEGGLSVPRPGLPRPRIRQARVAAEVDPDVQRMPSGVQTLEEAGTFMREEADPGGLFVRSEQLITPEQEAIAPPGAGFRGEDLFGIRVGGTDIPFTDRTVGGQIVTGRTFRRVRRTTAAPETEFDIDETLAESAEAVATTRRLQATDREPVGPPAAPVTPGVATSSDPFDVTTPTDPFAGVTEPTTTPIDRAVTEPSAPTRPAETAPTEPSAPSEPTGVSTPFGSVPSTPTGPTGPTDVPSTPPSAPPSGPGPSGPPPTTPTIPGVPTGPPPSRPPTFFEPEAEPSGRDEPERFPPPPEGQEFFNPIASGVQFLFGRDAASAGVASPFGDLRGPDE